MLRLLVIPAVFLAILIGAVGLHLNNPLLIAAASEYKSIGPNMDTANLPDKVCKDTEKAFKSVNVQLTSVAP